MRITDLLYSWRVGRWRSLEHRVQLEWILILAMIVVMAILIDERDAHDEEVVRVYRAQAMARHWRRFMRTAEVDRGDAV